MPLADKLSPAPGAVRLAGALVALPGLGTLALAVVLVVRAAGEPTQPGNNVFVEATTFAVLGLGFLACAVGLVLGRTWARSPGVVVGLLLIGVGWYILGPSGRPAWGVPFAVAGIAVLFLLFRAPSRAWALGQREDETEEEAAERGGLAGRRAEREAREEDTPDSRD